MHVMFLNPFNALTWTCHQSESPKHIVRLWTYTHTLDSFPGGPRRHASACSGSRSGSPQVYSNAPRINTHYPRCVHAAVSVFLTKMQPASLFVLLALVPLALGDHIDVSSYPFSATLSSDSVTGEPLYQALLELRQDGGDRPVQCARQDDGMGRFGDLSRRRHDWIGRSHWMGGRRWNCILQCK